MSAGELHVPTGDIVELRGLDIVELAALRGRAQELATLAERRGLTLPAMGRLTVAGDQMALCIRPQRWLLLTSVRPGVAAEWCAACAGVGVAVDLSSSLAAFSVTDPTYCAAFALGCRLDLDSQVFPAGHAAATIVAQVSVILARRAAGLLLLTPATTARHFREWLGEQVP